MLHFVQGSKDSATLLHNEEMLVDQFKKAGLKLLPVHEIHLHKYNTRDNKQLLLNDQKQTKYHFTSVNNCRKLLDFVSGFQQGRHF